MPTNPVNGPKMAKELASPVLQPQELWQDPAFSDLTLLIYESTQGPSDPLPSSEVVEQPGSKQQVARASSPVEEPKHALPCSRAILAAGSAYFKARFASDLEKGAVEFPLVVGAGEADAAAAVIKSIYCGVPEDATTAQLVFMCKIADRLQANSTELYVKALADLPAGKWDWETAVMVSCSHYEASSCCHAYGSQQQLCLNKVCDLSLTWIFWGVTRMRWCHLWELLGFELGVSVHLPASRGTLPVGIGVGICVCVCRCVVGSCSCVSTRGCMRCLGSRVCNCL